MGESTFVREMPAANRTPKKRQPRKFEVDAVLLITVVGLLVIGLLAVFSSSWQASFNPKAENPSVALILFKQVRWMLLGLAVGIGLVNFDYHRWKNWGVLLMGITLISLLVLKVISSVRGQVVMRGFFQGSGQPSELAKLAIIIYVSVWLCSKQEQLNNFTLGIFPLMVIIAFSAGLILIQPDNSAAITVIFLGVLLFYLAGSDLKHIVLLIVIAAIFVTFVIFISATVRERIQVFISGLIDPAGMGYHASKSINAMRRGGLFGVGIGKGTGKYGQNVPYSWTDSIFAIIAEEAGLIGSLLAVGLYALLLYQGLKISRNAPDQLGQLMAAGITYWIAFEALINIGGLVNVVPIVGNALPLMSSGGSSMITVLAALGILMNISRQSSFAKKTPEGRSYSAVVDLRGRDRRGRVSRRGRSTRGQRR